jgi:hypothetical protein
MNTDAKVFNWWFGGSATWEAETGRIEIQEQPGQNS